MNSLNIVLLFSVFMETKGNTYYVSKEDITAKDYVQGTRECQIAVPELVYSPMGVKVLVDPEIITEDVWIGYFRARTALEYFGCSKTDANTAAYDTTADPGQCMSACGGDNIIGISKTKCFCFEKEEYIKEKLQPHCDLDCGDNGPVCGGSYNGQIYMSLYRSIGFGIRVLRGADFQERKCMYLEEGQFKWGKCTTDEMAYMCESDNGEVLITNIDDKQKWNNATRYCLANGTRPSTYRGSSELNVEIKNRLWGGVVRNNVFYKYVVGNIGVEGKFAYLKIDKGKIVLRWDQFDQKKKVLCVNVTQTESSTTTTTTTKTTEKVTTPQPTPSSPPTSTVKKTTAAVTDSTSLETKLPSTTTKLDLSITTKTSTTVPSQTNTDTHTNTKLESNNKTGPSNTGFIVGAAVSAVVVIVIIIVVVVLFLRRRGNKQKQPPQQMSVHNNNAYAMSAPGQNQQNTGSPEEYADIDMSTAATSDKPESDYAHDYFILEKTDTTQDSTTDGRVKRADQSASNPYNNSGYEDGPYDTTGGVNQKPHEAHFNPYNHLGGYEEESSNYDHIGKNKNTNIGRFTTDAENTYNNTNIGYLKNSTSNKLGSFEKENPDYDHIGNDKAGNAASRNIAEEDNTYNNTNQVFLKTRAGTSDNIYNVTGGIGVDDTYSHINAKKTHRTGLKSSENDYDTFKK